MTSIGGDGARNDDGYDRKALIQVWQFSSYLDYGLGYNKSRGSCSSQCDDDEDEEACSTSGMATDVGSMSMTFSRRAKQDDDDDFGDDEYSPSKTDTSSCSTYWHITAIGDDVI